jgi:light-regulated signal transduction histidine kinase (bacteriophytochrome)
VNELRDASPNKTEIRVSDLHFAIADKPMMKIVLYNLIANAVKYSSPKERPYVQIDSVEEETQIIYRVADNGVGFDMNFASKLYTAFERLHSVKQFEGNGVGLAIVKRIIQKHGGDVWATSKEDCGSTFSFSLPKECTNTP